MAASGAEPLTAHGQILLALDRGSRRFVSTASHRRRAEAAVRPDVSLGLVHMFAGEFPDSGRRRLGLRLRQRAFLHGEPPKAVWLRVRNIATSEIEAFIRSHVETIEAFARAPEEAPFVVARTG